MGAFRKRTRATGKALSLSFSLFFFALCGVAAYTPQAVSAETVKYYAPQLQVAIPGLDFKNYPVVVQSGSIQVPFIGAYIGAVYRYLVGIGVIAAAVMIVYGGFKYILGSSVFQITSGKETIVDALIGLVLIFLTYTILSVVGGSKTLVAFKPVTVPVIDPTYFSHSQDLDGVPLNQMQPWDKPDTPKGQPPATETPQTSAEAPTQQTSTPQPSEQPPAGQAPAPGGGAPPAFSGADKGGTGKGCGASGKYHLPGKVCGTYDQCQKRFCDDKNYDIEGTPSLDQLVGFQGLLPDTVGEEITQKGITMVPPGACYKKSGCDATKYMAINLYGTKASSGIKNLMAGSRIFLPEARDALLKAGEIAKSQGYFLAIGDGTRTMKGQALNWCQRIKDSGSPKGMATPGRSPHQLGVAVDIGLFKYDAAANTYTPLTLIGAICQQVEITKAYGPDNLQKLEEIMAAAGFKHMCQEVWHYDYTGVYPIDCNSCDFPGQMQVRVDADKTCGK